MSRLLLFKRRDICTADRFGVATARMKAATAGNGHGGGEVVPEDMPRAVFSPVDRGDGGDERLGVGVKAVPEQVGGGGAFDDDAKVHDHHPVTDVPQHREIMGDDRQGQAVFGLHGLEQVDDLGLDGDVQG